MTAKYLKSPLLCTRRDEKLVLKQYIVIYYGNINLNNLLMHQLNNLCKSS